MALEACDAAVQSLLPYHAGFLGALVEQQARQLQLSYQAAVATRQRWQSLFSPSS